MSSLVSVKDFLHRLNTVIKLIVLMLINLIDHLALLFKNKELDKLEVYESTMKDVLFYNNYYIYNDIYNIIKGL